MLLAGVRSVGEMRTLQPTQRNFELLKIVLVILGVFSAWFVAPHPIPLLLLLLVWLCYGVPQAWRSSTREHIVRKHSLSSDLLKIDDADLRRLRRRFAVALLVIGFQLPFMTAYAISYPFLHRTAWYWWAVVPATQKPGREETGWTIRGVFLVKLRVETSRVEFELPTGVISFGPDESRGRLIGHWRTSWR
jgi:hypothetical protein